MGGDAIRMEVSIKEMIVYSNVQKTICIVLVRIEIHMQ